MTLVGSVHLASSLSHVPGSWSSKREPQDGSVFSLPFQLRGRKLEFVPKENPISTNPL